MESTRSDMCSTLSSFVPEFTEVQVQDLEGSIFNAVITMFEGDRDDSVWGRAFESLYRRTAAEMTSNLTSEPPYGNGNVTLLQRVLKGEVEIEDLPGMKPYELRPEVFEDVTTGARELEKAIETFTGVTSTMYQCVKCKSKRCTYMELQTRSSDEGTTTFVTCLECAHKWAFEG